MPAWDGIPYITNYPPVSSDGRDTHYLSTLTTYADNKGDICSFINSDYRMPRSEEFGAASDWSDWATGSSTSTNVSFGQLIIAGYRTFKANPVPFPASGCRSSGGWLSAVGVAAFYWSGSAYSTLFDSYGMSFDSDSRNMFPAFHSSRSTCFSVRCVKK
jgi:hypothetical protein